ncbi:putative peptide ABC transporter,substrate-binding protein [Nostocoides japonicum T1-X7]|uniref:Putative peptide ABC transporter,substrate-binding protein n=1 Tax=Nostocoides japonicum T1-X7 TaxID=1194083 RepID=A0A077LYP0_9MICO|nr:ABC transporter substrate-binding protein [Tetrasphaera japonica]CCH79028.1 putative peptide ABC transporter,substrate-binding protein [Tetrasphaera japonica T1-X7]
MPEPTTDGRNLSRRQLFKYSGGALAAVAAADALAACGGGGGGSGSSGGGGGSQASGGVLIHGATGGSSKDTIDPHRPVTAPDIARVSNLFEPLLFWDDNYQIAPAIAESVEPSADAKTWTVKLRQGVTFHNGKPVTPEDVLFTLNRVANPKSPTSAGGALSEIIDFDKTKKVDASTVNIVLHTPYAVLQYLLAEYTFGIVPTDFDVKNPVGTGAFKYKSFTPGQSSVFTKFDGYWGQKAFVDELHIQDFSDPNACVNALLAGQIQTMDNLPYNLMDSVSKQGGKLLQAETGAWIPFTMRVDQAPFSDVRVRQALRLICDRKQMIAQALAGHGTLGNDLYAPFDPAFAKDLPQREQDIDQAKSLLSAAGHSDLSVQLFTGDDIGSVAPASAALFVQQAKKAGVTVSVVKKTPFYGDDYLSYPFAQDFWNTRNYLPQAAVSELKRGTYNETHFNNPKFAQLIATAQATTDEAKRNTLLQDAQKIEYDEGGYIIWGFRQQVDAYGAKVQGIKPSKYLPLGSYKFQYASV